MILDDASTQQKPRFSAELTDLLAAIESAWALQRLSIAKRYVPALLMPVAAAVH